MGILDKIFKSKNEETDAKIQFKYHPNVWDLNVFDETTEENKVKCQCCNKDTRYYLTRIYTTADVDCICPECVANGKASEKFDGSYIQDAEVEKVSDDAKHKELFCRTPGYESWQGEYWLACCDDFCAYIGDVGTKELEEMGIADEVFAEYDARNEYEDARSYLHKAGSMAGYLFQCLHCKKYHLWVDAD